jgi:hypothetical protein
MGGPMGSPVLACETAVVSRWWVMRAGNGGKFDAAKKSCELSARHGLPRFNQSNAARAASRQWYTEHNQELIGKAISAATETVQKHFAEQAAKQKK